MCFKDNKFSIGLQSVKSMSYLTEYQNFMHSFFSIQNLTFQAFDLVGESRGNCNTR